MAIRKFSNSSMIAGSKSSKFWDQNTVQGTYESISTATCSANDASVVFSNIPQIYTHLQIRSIVFQGTSTAYFTYVTPGAIASSQHRFSGNGSSVSGNGYASGTYDAPFLTVGSYIVLDNTYPTAAITDIFDYTNTNKNKTIRTMSGIDKNGTGEIGFASSLSLSTNSITSLTIGTYGGTFGANSQFALYGIRGA